MRILMVDNYDSFTYNLVQYLGELGAELDVVRSDAETVDALLAGGYDRAVVSPGPCTPATPSRSCPPSSGRRPSRSSPSRSTAACVP